MRVLLTKMINLQLQQLFSFLIVDWISRHMMVVPRAVIALVIAGVQVHCVSLAVKAGRGRTYGLCCSKRSIFRL